MSLFLYLFLSIKQKIQLSSQKTWHNIYDIALCKYIKAKNSNTTTIELQIELHFQNEKIFNMWKSLHSTRYWTPLEIDFREKFPQQILLKHHKSHWKEIYTLKHWIKDWCWCNTFLIYIWPLLPCPLSSLFTSFSSYLFLFNYKKSLQQELFWSSNVTHGVTHFCYESIIIHCNSCICLNKQTTNSTPNTRNKQTNNCNNIANNKCICFHIFLSEIYANHANHANDALRTTLPVN